MIRYFYIFLILYAGPANLQQYVLLIIPLPKVTHKRPTEILPITDLNKRENWKENIIRIGLEHYDEPMHIDNFDLNDKGGDIFETSLYQETPNDFVNFLGEDKIVGGFEVDISLYPYHAGYGPNCGAAIIHKKWAITAGHCGKKSYIRVGSKYRNQGQQVTVKNHFIHPMWGVKTKEHAFDFDFQLLELADNLRFGNNVQSIKIARKEDMVVGKIVTVTGWGKTEENGKYSDVLRAVRLPIISMNTCQKVPFKHFKGSLTPRMFCAGYSNEKKDACQGDSGGPAVAQDRLIGIVSFGHGCATPGAYGVYGDVAKVRTWIKDVTRIKLA